MLNRRRFVQSTLLAGSAAYLSSVSSLSADESLVGKACRSVHLNYAGGGGTAFYLEAQARASAIGTYFCTNGWNTGYYGFQELGNGKKLLIFSVWDPGEQNDPRTVKEADRVALVEKHEKVRVGRFGGEGTGGQSFLDFDWKLDTPYRFLVSAAHREDRMHYTGWFFHPEEKAWLKLVTFSRIGGNQPLKGCYSFVEDFRRNGESAKQARRAEYGNVWIKNAAGEWVNSRRASFTGDGNPAKNVSSEIVPFGYSLATGGDTPQHADRLNKPLSLPDETKNELPKDLPL